AAINPHVAMSANGSGVAAWIEDNTTSDFSRGYSKSIFVSHYTMNEFGGSWGEPKSITVGAEPAIGQTTPTVTFYDLKVAIDDAGNAMIAWQENDGAELTSSNYYLMTRFYDAATQTWQSEQQHTIQNMAANYDSKRLFELKTGGTGAFYLMYNQDSPSPEYNDIVLDRFVAGSGWTGAQFINDRLYGTTFNLYPVLDVTESGNASVAWSRGNLVKVTDYIAGVGVQPTQNQFITNTYANIAHDSDTVGNRLMVWYNAGVLGTSYYDAMSDTTTTENIDSVLTSSTYRNKDLKLLNQGEGNWVLFWKDNQEVFSKRFDSATGWSTTTSVATQQSFTSHYLYFDYEVHQDDQGRMALVWREQNGPSTLFVRYSLDGANWTSPSQVAASDSSIYGPYLSVNELGFGLLSWSEIVSGEFVNKSINLDLNKVASAIALPEQLQTTKIVYAGDFYPGWLSNAEHAVATNTVYSTSAQAEESIDVASNTSGQGVAVWIDNDVLADQSIAQSKSLYISRYQQSGTNVNWQAAITLVDGQAMSTRMEAPQVLIDDAGNITVAYYEMNLANTSGNLMVMFYDASTNSWSAPTVKAPVSFPEWKPFQLHQGHNGDVYLVWTEGNTSTNPQPIKADRYVLGSGWIGETYLGGTYNADFNATVLPDGGLEVVWEISRAVRTMRYSVATGWAASQKLSIPGFGVLDGGNNIKLESDGLGNRLMVFVQASSPKINLWYSEGGAAWSTGFVVDTISSTLYNTNINPEIFKLDGDQWLVTWKNGGNLYTRVFDSVNGLSDTKLLGATSRGNSNYFDYRIEQDKQGRIVALWEDGASGAAVVKSRYYVPGRGWSDEVAQDGVGTGNKVLVDLSLDEQGQAFYLWNDWSSVGGGLIENNLSSHTFNFFSPTYQEFTLPPFHTVSASDTWENIAFAIYGDEQLAVSLQEYFASQGVTSLVEGMDLIMPLNFYYVKNETTSTRTMVEDLTRNTQTNYFLDEQNRLHEFYDQNQNRMVYGYDEDGRSSDNITSITDQNGNITRFAYDDQGNRTSMIDSEGVRVDYEYNDVNQIISETRYRVNDPDGADINNTGTGGVGASDAQSSFYIYDAEQHLVFTVSSEGVVNEYVYDTQGRQISQILYKGHIDTSALDPATPISATLLNQAPYNSVVNVGNILQRSDTTYDFRGNISTVTTFDSINPTTGAGVTTTASTTHFVYDAQGILIETIEAQAAATGETRDFITTFTYDGLGRLLASNKPLNHTTTYFYDDVGNQIVRTDANELQTTTVYDSHGYAISQSQQDGQLNPLGTIEYKYDSSGNLRLTIDQTGNYSQNYYDATNRLVATVDKEGGLTETVYDDAGRVIKTIEYSTPVLQSIVNYPYVAGSNFYELSAIKPNSSPSDRINYFIYDDADRLVMQLTPYDNDVTRVAVTQHFYDGSNQLTHSIAYANPFVITGMPNNPRAEYFLDSTTGTYVNEDANNDRRTRFFYNNDGQLVATLDAEGYLTETEYNAAGQVVKTSAYANRSTANLASASLQQLKDAIVRNLAKDQYSYNFYNAKGQLIANHDAEGYLSTFSYDLNGNETESIRYNNKALIISAKGIPADGTYPIMEVRVDGVLVDSIVVDSENFKDYQINALFDQRDTYTIDLTFVNNDLTSRDLQIQSITTGEHQQVVATPDTYSVSVAHGLIQKRLAHVNDKTIVKTYTELNQMETVTNSVDGLVTSYAYDDVGNLIRQTDSYLNALLEFADLDVSLAPENGYTVQSGDTWESIVRSVYHTANANAFVAFAELMGAASPTVGEMLNLPGRFSYTHNQRSSLLRYDIQGRLIGEQLNAQGIAKLDTLINPSESELDLLWEIYGVTHTYNEQGLRTSTKDQNDHRTWFYYDDNGRLRFTAQDVSGTLDESGKVLSNVAEVNELSYNQFGEVKETVAYSTRITNSNTLTGGLVTPSFLDRLSGNTMVDSRTQSSYNLRGAIWRAINGEGQRTEYAYNAFGQISSSVQQQDPTLIPVSQALTGQTSRSDTYVYDRRGLSTSTLKDVSVAGHTGLEIETKRTYDAFGRVIQSTDGNSNITQFGYDRLGRQVQTRNALDVSRSQTYDAFGRVLTMTDAFLNVTTYAYDDATHTLTVTTPELIQTQTITDRNGQTIKIIDGNQSAANSNDGTEYHYDTNGKLVKVVDMLNNTITSEYDKAGRLTHTVDKNGVYSKFEYDAANRVMTR
ncbi:MAG: hypothetical protein OEZ58_12170, partial [Gammaproteobacteria bacterium]|nr:hypothetical protein [Gammaproteobacteria bacterium]